MSEIHQALEETLDVYAAIADPAVADAEAAVRAAAREHAEGREVRWCLFHWSTAKSSPEYDYCRIAERSGQPQKTKVWCRIVRAQICFPGMLAMSDTRRTEEW